MAAQTETPQAATAAGTGHWEVVRPPEGLAQGQVPASAWVIAGLGGVSAAVGLAFVIAWVLRARRPRDQAPASRSNYPRASRAPRGR